ncbi:hypothetical protein [Roseibium sp.]|uniref:hypothetical protein n=1 Tax=Roseibium sp. TaxID=1936156 RepID=UPI0032980A66
MAFTHTPFDRASLPLGTIDETLVAESSPATRVAPASIGAGAGKIADWSIAGRIGEGQPVPRFGSVARSPHTGRGSDGRPVQFLDTPRIPSAAFPARVDVGVEFGGRLAVRLRVAGTAIRCDVLGAPPARGVFQVKQIFHSGRPA